MYQIKYLASLSIENFEISYGYSNHQPVSCSAFLFYSVSSPSWIGLLILDVSLLLY